jgi:hypothetical protein
MAILAMFAGGTVAAGGRFVPAIALGLDPVIAGTLANLLFLLPALAAGRRGPA